MKNKFVHIYSIPSGPKDEWTDKLRTEQDWTDRPTYWMDSQPFATCSTSLVDYGQKANCFLILHLHLCRTSTHTNFGGPVDSKAAMTVAVRLQVLPGN